jgi:hypothetical protein
MQEKGGTRMTDRITAEIEVITSDFEAYVKQDPDGRFTLWWGDHVANVWEEKYQTLGAALMRLAALEFCCSADRYFAHDSIDFGEAAARFVVAETIAVP